MYNRLGEEGTGVLKSAPFYMVREALFSLDSIEIGFEKAWVINLLVRFIRFVQKHVELKLTKTISSLCLFCFVCMDAIPKERSGYPIRDFASRPGTEQKLLLP